MSSPPFAAAPASRPADTGRRAPGAPRALRRGFTLVELMIVVAIVGVLAVLAVYGVRKYIANAKTAEAKNSLGQIGKDAVTAYEGERMAADTLAIKGVTAVVRRTCGNNTGGAVPDITKVKGQKYQSEKLDWSKAEVREQILALLK